MRVHGKQQRRLGQEAAHHFVDGLAVFRERKSWVASTARRQISTTRAPGGKI